MKFDLWPGSSDDIRSIEVQAEQIGQATPTILALSFNENYLYLYSRSLKNAGVTYAILGVNPIRPGCGAGWGLISEQALAYPLALTRTATFLIERGRYLLNLRRLEITVDIKHDAALRWAEFLGFEQEGTMRCYGLNGEDVYRMARIWP